METKICTKCGRQLPIEDFYWRNQEKGIRRSDCKQCHNNYVKMMYNQKHEDIETLKAYCKCAKCGESRGYVLDFHHRDPNIKEEGIARLISSNASLSKIKEEIDKCVVLCANCHREFHFLQKKDSSFTIEQYLNTDINIKYSDLIQQPQQLDNIIWKQKEQKSKDQKKNYCIDCGIQISKLATRCPKCANKKRQIITKQFTREELKQLIRTKPFTQIGADYHVSDNAIRKWCDKFNLPRTKKEINSYSDEEWQKI